MAAKDAMTLTRVVGSKAQYNVTVVGHCNGVLERRQIVLSVQQTASIEVKRVLQIDLLDVGVGRSTDTDHVEAVAVQMERMTQIGLLHYVLIYI